MTDQRVRIRIRLRQPVEDNDCAVPLREGLHLPYRWDSLQRLRKRGRSRLFALGSLGGILAVGLVVAYVSWPTNEFEPSRSEVAGIKRAVISANGSIDNGADMDGTQGTSAPGSRSSWALRGPTEALLDLNLATMAELAAQREPVEASRTKRAEDALPALPDMKHDQGPEVAEAAQEAAGVLVPGQMVGQDDRKKALVSLWSSQCSEVVPTADRRVARSHLTSHMQGREPADRLGSRVMLAGRESRTVFYFTELRDLAGRTVLHRWERNGQVVATLLFKVEGQRWRVYSSNTLTSSETGRWRVVVVDTQGAVLANQDFVVVQR